MKKITVIIPCYNEASAIAAVISKFPKAKIAAADYALEIIVIDNNSSDNTSQVARKAGATVIFEPNRGKGNAVRSGFYAVSPDTDYVVMLDGDDTYAPEEIMRLIEPIESDFAKVIIGSRMFGRMNEGSMRAFNKFGNRMYSQLVRAGYNIAVNDVLTGYYAWSMEVVEQIRPYLSATDFTIEMELITKMARLGYQIYCVPISYEQRLGDSSLKPIRDGSRIMRTYVRNLRWHPASEKLRVTDRLKSANVIPQDLVDDYQLEARQ